MCLSHLCICVRGKVVSSQGKLCVHVYTLAKQNKIGCVQRPSAKEIEQINALNV